MESDQSRRKGYLDIAKGIGILLVVLGHCPLIYTPLKQWIYSFHMPLFFIVAGMVWNKASHEKRGYFSWRFFADKIRRLIVPCFFWGVIYMVFDAIINRSFSPKKIAYLLYGSQNGFRLAGSLSSLWFLPAMFLSVCAFEIIQQLLAKTKLPGTALLGVSAVCAAAGLFLPRIRHGYPWSADVAFLAVAFMIWGYLAKGLIENAAGGKASLLFLLALLLLAVSLTFILNLPYLSINNADLAGRYFGNRALFLLGAAAGSAFTLLLAGLLCRSRHIAGLLSDLGKRTFPILFIHKPIVRELNSIGDRIGIPAVVTVTVSVIIAAGLSVLIYQLVKNILPIAFGENRKKRAVPEAGG